MSIKIKLTTEERHAEEDTTDLLKVVTPNGEYYLTYEPRKGLKLSAVQDVLHIIPHASNSIAIKRSKMIDEMEKG